MANARVQHRHGTQTEYESAVSGGSILPEEVVIVDSGANTDSGKAMYYKASAGDPVRLLNEEERGARVITDEFSGDGIPMTYAGRLGEIVLYNSSLYYLSQIINGNYYWYRLLDETDQ